MSQPAMATIEPEDYRQVVQLKLALIGMIGLCVYLNSLMGVFVLQDERILNPDIHQLSGKAFWSTSPTVNVTLALNYAISGANPWSYHLVNVIVHILAALTLFGIACRTMLRAYTDARAQQAAPWLAFAVAVLWLAHPLQTQSVTYVIQRTEALMGLLYLLTLYCVIRGAEAPQPWLWYGLAIAACALGMGTKLTMATAPVVVLLYDRIYLSSSFADVWRRRGLLYAGLAACWVLLAVLYAVAGYNPLSGDFPIQPIPPLTYALAQCGVIVHYLRLASCPYPLTFDYFDWPLNESAGSVVLPGVIVAALLAATVVALVRWPKIGFLGAWFFLTLAPTSSFLPQPDVAAENRMYLPLAGLVALFVVGGYALARWTVRWFAQAEAAAAVVAVVLLAVLGFMTFLRNQDYYSAQELWGDTVKQRPENARARLNLGNAFYQQANALSNEKKYDEARKMYDQAIAEYQALTEHSANLDSANAAGQEYYRRAALPNLAIASFFGDHLDDALATYRRMPDGETAKVVNQLGILLWTNKKAAPAARFFQEAVRRQPETARYHYELAVALEDAGDKEAAQKELQEGRRLGPQWPQEVRRQAWERATNPDPKSRDGVGAVFLARQASLATGDKDPKMLDTLAAAYAAAGRFAEAIKTAEEARKLAEKGGNTLLAREIEARMSLYRQQQPYVQGADNS